MAKVKRRSDKEDLDAIAEKAYRASSSTAYSRLPNRLTPGQQEIVHKKVKERIEADKARLGFK